MKQNISIRTNILGNHPSKQSKPDTKPCSIKVNYKILRSNESSQNFNSHNRKININKNSQSDLKYPQSFRANSLSGIQQQSSGRFVSQYYRKDMNEKIVQKISMKAKIQDARQKYQQSQMLKNTIKNQFIKKDYPSSFISKSRSKLMKSQQQSFLNQSMPNKSKISEAQKYCTSFVTNQQTKNKSSRSKLPAYSNQGIKDIIEYEHAGKYNEYKLNKNNKTNAADIIKDKFRAFNQIHQFDFRKRFHQLTQPISFKGLRH